MCTNDPESLFWVGWIRSWLVLALPSPRGIGCTQIQLPTGRGTPFLWLPTAPTPRSAGAGQLFFSATVLNVTLLSSLFASHGQAHHPGPDMTPYRDRRTHISCLSCWPLCCHFPPTESVPYLKLCHIVEFILRPDT